jgi:hypothetical protein
LVRAKNAEVHAARDKAAEIGSELLSEVNRGELLQKDYDMLAIEHKEKVKELEALQRKAEIDSKAMAALENDIKAKDKEIYIHKKQNFDANGKKKAGFDDDAAPTRRGSDAANELLTDAERLRRDKLPVLLEKQLSRCRADLEETEIEKKLLGEELESLRVLYRQKLSTAIDSAGAIPEPYHHHYRPETDHVSKRNPSKNQPSHEHRNLRQSISAESVVRNSSASSSSSSSSSSSCSDRNAPLSDNVLLQQSLIDSYVQREEANKVQLDGSLGQKGAMKKAYRELFDKYSDALELMRATVPKVASNPAKLAPLEESISFSEERMAEAEEYMSSIEQQERLALRERIERAERASAKESERMAYILSTYQKNLEIAERKLAGTNQENLDLKIQMRQLVKTSGERRKEW